MPRPHRSTVEVDEQVATEPVLVAGRAGEALTMCSAHLAMIAEQGQQQPADASRGDGSNAETYLGLLRDTRLHASTAIRLIADAALADRTLSYRKIATAAGVSVATVQQWARAPIHRS